MGNEVGHGCCQFNGRQELALIADANEGFSGGQGVEDCCIPGAKGGISNGPLNVSRLFSQAFFIIIDVTSLFSCGWEEIGGGVVMDRLN
jgi:hypothetical protein